MVRAHVLLGLCLSLGVAGTYATNSTTAVPITLCPVEGGRAGVGADCTCNQANPYDSECNYTKDGADYCMKTHNWAGSSSRNGGNKQPSPGVAIDTATNTNGLGFCPGKQCNSMGDNTDPNCYCPCSWGSDGIADAKPWYVTGDDIVGNTNGEDKFRNSCCKVSFSEGGVTKYGCIANTGWKNAEMNYQTQKYSTLTESWSTTGYAKVGATSTATLNGIAPGFEDRCRSSQPENGGGGGSGGSGTPGGSTSDAVFDKNFTSAVSCTADTAAKNAGGNGLSGVGLIVLIIFFALAGPVLFGARVYAKKGRFCTTRQTSLKLFIALTAFGGIALSVMALLSTVGLLPIEVTLCGNTYSLDNEKVKFKKDDTSLKFADCDWEWCKTCADQTLGLVMALMMALCCGGVFLFTLCRFCVVKDGKAKCSGKADKILKAFTIICSGGGVLFGCLFVMMGSTCAQAFRDEVAIGENSISQSIFGGVFPILGAVFSAGTALFIVLGTSAGKLSCCCLVWDEEDGYVRMKGKSNAVKPDEGV